MKKTKLLVVPLKIFFRRAQKNAEVNAKNESSQLSSKNVEKVYAFDLIYNDVLQNNIVPALFSFFFEDLNVLPAVSFTIEYRFSKFFLFKFVFGLFQINSEKLLTRTAV